MTQSDALWHSLDGEGTGASTLLREVPADRRAKARFPVDLPFRYFTLDVARHSGEGRVLNISSSDVLVECRHRILIGTSVELVIDWPARFNGTIPMNLVMCGKIYRCDVSGFAVGRCQHRFRLAGRATAASASPSVGRRNVSSPKVGSLSVSGEDRRVPGVSIDFALSEQELHTAAHLSD
jgi:hypothetical protein